MTAASIYEGQSTVIPVANSLGNVFEEWQVATAGQTVFNIVSFQYTPGTFSLLVFKKPVGAIGGSFMQLGVDYAETDADTVTFVAPLAVGDKVAFYAFATDGIAIPNGGGVPIGGTAGQILAKIDSSDYNSHWINVPGAMPLLDAPMQTLSSANTVDLTPLAAVTRNISLSGTTNINGFQVANGELFSCRITGTFQFVHSVSLICPGAVSVNAVPGASCFIRAVADNVVELISYSTPVASISPVAIRHAIQQGVVDSSGDPAFVVAGAGLAINLVATATPLVLSYAGGSSVDGDINYLETFNADTANIVTGLAASNLTYVSKTYQGNWNKTLAPYQAGKAFDRSAQMLVRWPGANNAVTTTEDFGNTLTLFGNAKLSTGTQILGLNTVALDGTGDYVQTPLTYLGQNSWEIFGSFRTASLAAAQRVFTVGNAGGFGVFLDITTGGLFNLSLSSNGTSNNIANATAGTAVIAINTTYYFRVTFDAVGSTYRVYLSNNGAAETQDISVASGLRIYVTTTLSIGATVGGTVGFNGFIGFFGYRRFASVTSAAAAGPVIAPTYADVACDWFNISSLRVYQVTAASTVAGTNPTLTAVNKIYTNEITTSGAAVTAVVNYAYKRRYNSGWFAVVNNTTYDKASNIGVPAEFRRMLCYYRQNASFTPRILTHAVYDSTAAVSYGAAVGGPNNNTTRVRTGSSGVAGGAADLSSNIGSNDGVIVVSGQYLLVDEGDF